MTPRASVYLAGPDVFAPDVTARLAHRVAVCERLGLRALVPVDNDALPVLEGPDQALAIYRGNLAKMEQATAILANITPFRGPHMDPGTAFEIGFFVARGKPVVCYSESPQPLADRVLAWSGAPRPAGAPALRDKEGALIEDFNLRENLMIEASMRDQHASAQLGHGVPAQAALICFSSFEDAARALAHHLCAIVE